MAGLEIRQFECLKDNYGVLVRDTASDIVLSIDAPETGAVRKALADTGWRLTHILTTHHHGDHTAGNLEIKAETGARIIGPRAEAARIPGLDESVGEGDVLRLGGVEIRVLDTPGHTSGHISYWIPASKVAFVGDTLFAMGCGRVIEGTMEMMWRSLAKIKALPAETALYCGHEYTVSNARFALTIEPENEALVRRARQVEAERIESKPTLPTRLDIELQTNPFLRTDQAGIRKRLGLEGAPEWQVFAEIRERKNRS